MSGRRMGRAALSAVTFAVFAVSCGRPGGSGHLGFAQAVAEARARRQPLWIIPTSTLVRMQAESGSADAFSYLEHHVTFLACQVPPAQCGRLLPPSWSGGMLPTFQSLAEIQRFVQAPSLPQGTDGLVYDTDAWPLTPLPEQRDPGGSTGLAAQAAHRRGLPLIAAPGVGLAGILDPASGSPYAPEGLAAFLRLGIVGAAAAHADVIVIQAQGLGSDPHAFGSFVSRAASQARSENPHVLVVALLATNAGGRPVTAGVLADDMAAVDRLVDGFWLNVPAEGATCPGCGQAHPEIAIRLFDLLEGS